MDNEPLFTEEEIIKILDNIFPPNIDSVQRVKTEVECECGAEKCGSPRHSIWCPKYED